MKRLILALAMVVMVSPAWGEKMDVPNTVEKMLSACEGEDGPANFGYCVGATDAIASTLQTGIEGIGKICPPAGGTTLQLMTIFTNWAKSNPEQWHEMALTHIGFVALKAWPCP
jgi:hypothetical protein